MQFPQLPGLAWIIAQLVGVYVRITGDTMTGQLVISIPASGGPLVMQSQGATTAFLERYDAVSAAPAFTGRKARGTIAAPAVIATNDEVVRMLGQAFDGTSYRNGGRFTFLIIDAAPSATSMASRWQLDLNDVGSVTPAETLRADRATGFSMFGANIVVDANRVFRNRIFTVGTLPAGVNGMRTFVSDSTVTLALGIGAVVVGGGANIVPVYYDGAWRAG